MYKVWASGKISQNAMTLITSWVYMKVDLGDDQWNGILPLRPWDWQMMTMILDKR